MEEKQICCCGSRGWTRVIGWFDFVLSIIFLTVVVVLLLGISVISLDDLANAPGASWSPGNKKDATLILTVATVGLAFMLVILVLSLAMSIILLKGSYNKNPRYLHAWIVVSGILLVLSQISYFISACYSPSGGVLAFNLVMMIISGVVGGFCIWVVNTHKKEMEASQVPVYPVKA